MHSSLFAPVMALVLWTFVMVAWLYATRIPAIVRAKIVFDPTQPAASFHAQLPPSVRWKADNYDHLLQQPTLFYAVAIVLSLSGADGRLNTGLAWLYVTLRVIHSLVQATANVIMIRFSVFAVATLVLLALAVRAALVVF